VSRVPRVTEAAAGGSRLCAGPLELMTRTYEAATNPTRQRQRDQIAGGPAKRVVVHRLGFGPPSEGRLSKMTTMQVAVQDRILTAVALDRDVSTSEVLAGCPEGANERDFLRAVWLLFSANALTGPPLALTDEGRRRLVPAWRRSRERDAAR
jgi:hypothetical protein